MFGRGFMAGTDQQEQIKEHQKMLEAQISNLDPDKDRALKMRQMEAHHLQKKMDTVKRNDLPILQHWTDKPLDQMTERDWRIFREEFNITTKGGALPKPIRSWDEAPLRSQVIKAIHTVGYKDPTPIQRQAIPIALQGRDLMGIAETGSGKTASFVIPMLEYVLNLPPMTEASAVEGPYALILAPARELAIQIEQECSRFAKACGIRCVCIVGGTSIEEQGFLMRGGVEVVIATPGRLVDMIESRYLVLNQCSYVVLDEADRMIDLGFEPQVNAILDAMPQANMKSEIEEEAEKQEGGTNNGELTEDVTNIMDMRQIPYRTTIMYSATMPIGVERLSRKYLRRPAYVIIGEIGKAVDRIQQKVEWVSNEAKLKRLTDVLNDGPPPPIMIFCNQKKTCDVVCKHLERAGWRATTLHAGRQQSAREAALEGFKSGRFDVLVATNLAGRGIDVSGITHVVNFDMSKTIEEYVHRIGRTGRAGLSGLATTFINQDDTDVLFDIKTMLQANNLFCPSELSNHPAAQHKPGAIPDRPSRKDTIIYAKS
eukprot:TRINITY_DN2375_c0_g1_i1.p1 TRINITY_DN2375_c0_g1~~TRINITY_DN2375_c0_g1_i1.p1  ORF type:complete len:542 (-),score=178.75 TRINITY_DN2375_c0_g1_i1:160-1785(-)